MTQNENDNIESTG